MTVEQILAAMQELIDAATESGEPMPAEDVARYETLEGQLQAARTSEELVKRQAAYRSVNVNLSGVVNGAAAASAEDEVSRAFDQYMRTGTANESLIQRAQSEGSAGAGGYLVPEGFRNLIVERMKQFGGLANVAETITTDSGQPLPWVSNDDVDNQGEIVAEGAAGASGADLVFDTKSLGAYKYRAGGLSGLPLKVSVELLQDSAFNVQEFVARRLGERLARQQAVHWITGSGVNAPQGLLDTNNGLTPTTAIGSNTVGPDYEELLDTIHALDPAYRDGASWLFNDATLAKIRKLVDLDGRPLLWNAGMDLGATPGGLTLLGYPVVIDQAAPSPAASNWFGAFGNFREAYVIRRVKDVQLVTLNELYAPNGQVGFFVWARADGMVQDPNAAVAMLAAS